MKTLRPRKKRHVTGQLSIFAILIFQVLFILFAMSLNIALVVHDKINLQNSVDIAAYYGAMKQAEMMNAIAHINYQIRQSWKLLTWRYRVLGSVSITDSDLKRAPDTDSEHTLPVYENRREEGPYLVCVGHPFWKYFLNPDPNASSQFKEGPDRDGDHMCEKINTDIPALVLPPRVFNLGQYSHHLENNFNLSQSKQREIADKCNFYGFNSWMLGINFFAHFRYDQSARKYMIYELAKVLAENKDLDDKSISEGVRKTFKRNLSFINKKSFDSNPDQLKQFSSLKDSSPEKWLRDQELKGWHGFYSNSWNVDPTKPCKKKIDTLQIPPQTIENTQKAQDLTFIATGFDDPHQSWPLCAEDSKFCLPSAGMKKIENFIVFYSVKAELDYKNQIFLPFSTNITLKAKAFAKPFGGTIGPNTTDTQDSPSMDPLLPKPTPVSRPRIPSLEIDKKHSPNYSRYPGDKWGLRSSIVHNYWAKYIKSNPEENNIIYYLQDLFPEHQDPLAKGYYTGGTNIRPRGWEIAAVAPDLFDVTYFTILPYYQQTYYPKVYKLIPDKNYLRGNFGTRFKKQEGPRDRVSILEQVGYDDNDPNKNIWKRIPTDYYALLNSRTPSIYNDFASTKPFYNIKNLNLLLTGWNPPKRKYDSGDNDYDANNETNFGECFKWVHEAGVDPYSPSPRGKIANGCIYGGRTGYSVKMVSDDLLVKYKNASNPFPPGDPEWW
ncbi:MAG: Tad domain-containing protein [Bdellovibrionales bacterium]|nr:Tad domain-containing protein [Bdellovibrionales bacterium]